MVLNPQGMRSGSIRRATLRDDEWLRDTAGEVYAAFGDYRTIIPSWLSHPGVLTFVEQARGGVRRGFILLGFYEPSPPLDDDEPPSEYVADLLAIAVAPGFQSQGIGTRLIKYAIDLSALAGQRVPVPQMRLTVAHTNIGAQRMFARHGFRILDDEHGSYDGGQRAIRMHRSLDKTVV